MSTKLLIPAVAAAALAVTMASPAPATAFEAAAGPSPVHQNFADPSVHTTDNGFVGVATGGPKGLMATAATPRGPWKNGGAILSKVPSWAAKGGMWAPTLQKGSNGTWIAYGALPTKGMETDGHYGQRCIVAAVSTKGPKGPYVPTAKPLVCPPEAKVPGLVKGKDGKALNPPGRVGFIDASTFVDAKGRNILLVKSQRPEQGTKIYSAVLDKSWTKPTSTGTILVQRKSKQIENPQMVVKGGHYYLLASYDNWDNCTYKTVWLRSDKPRSGFPSGDSADKATKVSGVLLKSRKGLCGPGGMSIAKDDKGLHAFFHAYHHADPANKRDMFAGSLVFEKGKPKIAKIYSPAT